MYLFLTILIFLASILLTLIVLVQNSKGGGLASGFSSSNQVMGVRKTTDFLEKATWTLAAVVALLSVISAAYMNSDKDVAQQSIIKNEVQNAVTVDPNLTAPNFGDQGEAGAPAAKGAAAKGEAPAANQAQQAQQAPAQAPASQTPAAKAPAAPAQGK